MNYSPVQDGQRSEAVGEWEETGDDFYAFQIASAGVAFSLPTDIALTAASLTLSWGPDYLGLEGAPLQPIDVYVDSSEAPAPWSSQNFPTELGLPKVGSFEVPTNPTPVVVPLTMAPIQTVMSFANWSGRLAFVVSCPRSVYVQFFSQENADVAKRPLLSTTEVQQARRPHWHYLRGNPYLGGVRP